MLRIKQKIMTTTIKKNVVKSTAIIGMFALVCGLLFTNCKKEGPQGPAGKDGTNGNANVVSSSITSSSWVYSSPSWSINFTYGAITQDIIDRGAVLVYMKVGSAYNQIPITFYPANNYSRTYDISTYVGGVTIYCTDSDLTQPTNPGTLTFKVVVIAASQLIKNPNVDLKNYTAVKQAFNISN